MSSAKAEFQAVAPGFLGAVLQPGDPGYDDARRVHNGLIDKKPAIIASCSGTADVSEAVTAARAMGRELAIRGGGHNVAGRSTCDDGVLIDLSPMKGIVVDRRTRIARAQGGVLWREFNRETQLYGLATTGGVVATTGIAGLTLGGGIGWLMPKYGLALDNLLAAEVVLADGSVVRASEDEHPDLFWAIRGGGSNFGVAASFEYALHDVGPMITGGLVAHPASRGAEVLDFFRRETATLPDEMMLVAALITAHDGSGRKMVGLQVCHCGTLADGERAVAPIKAFGPPVVDFMGPIPYAQQNRLLDDAFPKGALNYWKSQFVADLSDGCIDVLLTAIGSAPTPMCQIVVEHLHGFGARVPVGATACAMRREGFNVVIIGQWIDPGDTDRGMAWVRSTFMALSPYLAPFQYVNYLESDAAPDAAAKVYGPNYARLRELKTQYDPQNVFHTNVNIAPSV